MQMKDRLRALRLQHGLTQAALASQLHVTRQAVSRWETGDTEPGTESLKLLSRLFSVSVNTLLGSPRALVCQCCGMPLTEDGQLSRSADGSLWEAYCRWCVQDGRFVYRDIGQLIDAVLPHLVAQYGMDAQQARRMLEDTLPRLPHWQAAQEAEDG